MSSYNRLIKKYNWQVPTGANFRWVDLMTFFKSVPIGIKGVFNWGLKNVAHALKDYGLIETEWPNDELDGGLSAMIAATHCHTSQGGFRKLSQMDGIKEVVKYNEVDCKVMMDILGYLMKEKLNL